MELGATIGLFVTPIICTFCAKCMEIVHCRVSAINFDALMKNEYPSIYKELISIRIDIGGCSIDLKEIIRPLMLKRSRLKVLITRCNLLVFKLKIKIGV